MVYQSVSSWGLYEKGPVDGFMGHGLVQRLDGLAARDCPKAALYEKGPVDCFMGHGLVQRLDGL